MLVSEVINRARTNLHDAVATYRWSDAELLTHYNDAVIDIRNRRPDARWDTNGDMVTFAEATATSDTAILSEYWRSPLVNFVLYRAFDKDSDETHDSNRSRTHLQYYVEGVS